MQSPISWNKFLFCREKEREDRVKKEGFDRFAPPDERNVRYRLIALAHNLEPTHTRMEGSSLPHESRLRCRSCKSSNGGPCRNYIVQFASIVISSTRSLLNILSAIKVVCRPESVLPKGYPGKAGIKE